MNEGKEKSGFLRLLELAGKKKTKLVAACALSVLSSAAKLVPYFTIYGIIVTMLGSYNDISGMDKNRIMLFTGITFAAALVYGICAYSSSALAHTAAYDIIYELRIRLLGKLGKLPSGFFTGKTQGGIKKILSDDTEQVEIFVAHHLCDIASSIATPVFTLIYLFVMDWRLALITLVPIIISLVLLTLCLVRPDKASLQIEMHDSQEAMQGTIVQYIHGMPVIKIFNRSLAAFRRYEGDINRFVSAVDKTARANAWPMSAYYVFFGAQLLFLLPSSAWILSRAESYIDYLPVALLFLLVGTGLREPMENMMQMVILSGRITEGVKRMDGILKTPELVCGGCNMPGSFDIEISGVSYSYTPGIKAVNNVNCTLGQGTITGLAGPSGGGKSTLAALLLRFFDPDNGVIKIGGTDLRDFSAETLSNLVSYVFQESVIFHDTVENNIRMGNKEASMEQVIEAAKAAEIHDVIMALPNGYKSVIGGDGAFLSGGEQQRLSIARVFLRNTPIVILDEATAYADAENEAKIQNAFARMAKDKTVLIIAHRLKTIEKADQILIMKDGHLLDCGKHMELLARCNEYKEMVDANERRNNWTIKGMESKV
ncbi:MAG: ABC transporter ATP-binding protein/permease [Oscillospiraceae bacterium]|nr:ABC transporter ATP-binding protein/permease [Oscillospiraceae bacterium]